MSFEKTYLFEGLSLEFLDKVSQAMTEETFEKGTYICRQGETASTLYFLTEGRIRITVGAQGSVAKTLSSPGEAFGWSSLVGSGSYTASVRCLDVTRVKKISGQEMNQILEEDPSAGVVFFRRLAGFIRERLIDSYRSLLTYQDEKKPHSYG